MTTQQPDKPKRRLRWYQFSLRALLVFVLAVGIGLGLLGRKLQQLRSQRLAIQELENLGVQLEVRYGDAGSPWRLLGDDFAPVVYLWLVGGEATDASLVHLRALTSLERLDLLGTEVTDGGLVHLSGLTNLRELRLAEAKVTDAGMVHLSGLTNLRELNLMGTRVTDDGLVHLKGLTSLQFVSLPENHVSEAAIKQVCAELPCLRVHLVGPSLFKTFGGDTPP